MISQATNILAASLMSLGLTASFALAGPLMDRAEKGETIRLGFMILPPLANAGPNEEPAGIMNAFTVDVLKKMGYTNVEAVVMDWGGLIPALQANRIDIITGGMYITRERCENVEFANPMMASPDVLIVPKGNPKELHTYTDLVEKDAVIAEPAGYATIETAKRYGVPDANIMALPGGTQVLAALRAGRADAFAASLIEAGAMLESAKDAFLELSDPSKMPEDTKNWIALAFRNNDEDFVKAFNEAQSNYMNSDEMMATNAPLGYTEAMLPGKMTAAEICE